MNTWSCVSEMAKPWGRVNSASQPTTVSTSSTLSTRLPSGCPRQSLIGVPSSFTWAAVMGFAASHRCCPYTSRRIPTSRSCSVRSGAPAGSLRSTKSSKLVSCRRPYCRRNSLNRGHSSLAVPDEVEGGHVDLARRAPGMRQVESLQEPGVVLKGEPADTLAPQGQGPAREAVLPHRRRRPAPEGVHHGDPEPDDVGIPGPRPVLDEIRNHRMQAVHRDELLGEVERRPEVVRPAVDVVGVREAPDVRLPRPGRRRTRDCRARRCPGPRRRPSTRRSPSRRPGTGRARGGPARARPGRAHRRRAGPTSWPRGPGAGARRTGAGASTRRCGSWRSPPRSRGAPPRTARRPPRRDSAGRGRAARDRGVPSRCRGRRAACRRNASTKRLCSRAKTLWNRLSPTLQLSGNAVASWPAHRGLIGSPASKTGR